MTRIRALKEVHEPSALDGVDEDARKGIEDFVSATRGGLLTTR